MRLCIYQMRSIQLRAAARLILPGGSGGAGPREVTLRPRQSEPRSRRSIVFTLRIVAAEYDLLRRRRDVWPWNNVFGDLCGVQHENAADCPA